MFFQAFYSFRFTVAPGTVRPDRSKKERTRVKIVINHHRTRRYAVIIPPSLVIKLQQTYTGVCSRGEMRVSYPTASIFFMRVLDSFTVSFGSLGNGKKKKKNSVFLLINKGIYRQPFNMSKRDLSQRNVSTESAVFMKRFNFKTYTIQQNYKKKALIGWHVIINKKLAFFGSAVQVIIVVLGIK